ncbi:SpoIID/LytB domain-containing protein [Cytobacillus firmus]|uniref:SpoIID/LytB domain-containing protein n=3 Tax=Paenibacillus lautus TaxID=1401 RepID=UPI00384C922A|nr:SpoIID/LytB domain-containing protein [Cytobacillus firmus]
MFQFKKLYVMALATFLFTFVGIIGTNSEIHASNSDQFVKSPVPEVIQKYVNSINNKDWDSYVNLYSPDNRLTDFPGEEQQKNRTGILSVDSIEISEIKEISEKDINEIQPYFSDIDRGSYQDIKYFYIGLDYNVQNENEFFYNGVRYQTFAVGKLNGVEYILGNEFVYNFDKLETLGYTFDSAAEDEAIIREERRLGGNDNPYNNGGIQPQSSTNPTNGLTLYITSTKTLKTLGFDDYAKDVLPNEWYASMKSEALKAGAVAIKSYAWYNVTYPRRPATDFGAHLTDKHENYQHYVPGKRHANTNAAVDSVSGIFMRNSDGVVFDTQYRAGTEGQPGTESGGVLSQHGTQYLATNYPLWNYRAILGYYYNFSDKSSGYIQVR